MYASAGRPSIPPEKLLRAQLLQMLYSVRSERMLMEEIDYNMLFRWFVGLNMDEEVWDVTVFTKNRDRLLEGDVAKEFLAQVVAQARRTGLTSDEHFTVDGTSAGSLGEREEFSAQGREEPLRRTILAIRRWTFTGRSGRTRRTNRRPIRMRKMARKGQGKEAKLSLQRESAGGEPQRADRVDTEVFEANGTAERDAALVMLEQIPGTKR